MAAGNFDVDSKDKSLYRGDFTTLLTSIENIIDKLSDTLHQINIAADQVSAGSDQVSAGAQALSQGATDRHPRYRSWLLPSLRFPTTPSILPMLPVRPVILLPTPATS